MKNFVKLICTISLLLVVTSSNAAVAWHFGKINRVYLHTDGFIVTFESAALDDCAHKYAYFKDSVIGEKTVSRAYSMALAAKAAGQEFGVVIDKAINGPGGDCDVIGGQADIR